MLHLPTVEDNLGGYINAGFPILYIYTYEETKADRYITSVSSKLEMVDWYLDLLEVGSKKYIVPQSREYLEMVRDQLMECHKQIMSVKIKNPNDRPIIDIKYPKGYEG